MTNPISVSIIVPTYNRVESLKRTIDSILNQTYKNFEIIVVDDGSETDISQSLKDLPVTKLLHQEHAGANVARNLGFAHSKGEFLLFCDDDVELEPDFLEKMVQTLRANPDKAYAYCGFELDEEVFGMEPFDPEKLRRMNYINVVALIRRSKFPTFDPSIKRLQDWDLWLKMLEKGFEGVLIPKALFRTTRKNKPCISDDSNPDGWTFDHAYMTVYEKYNKTSVPKALWTLIIIYNHRPDLQEVFPEAKTGDLRRLIAWAHNVLTGKFEDRMQRELIENKDIYEKLHSENISKIEIIDELKSQLDRMRRELSDRDSKIIKLEAERLGLIEEHEKTRTELFQIKWSLSFSIIRFFTKNIDRLMPNGTKRGEFRKIIIDGLNKRRK